MEELEPELNWVPDKIISHKHIKHRKNNFRTEYLVQWQNKGPEHHLWIVDQDLEATFPEIVSAYWSVTRDDRPKTKTKLLPNGVPEISDQIIKAAWRTTHIEGGDTFDDDDDDDAQVAYVSLIRGSRFRQFTLRESRRRLEPVIT